MFWRFHSVSLVIFLLVAAKINKNYSPCFLFCARLSREKKVANQHFSECRQVLWFSPCWPNADGDDNETARNISLKWTQEIASCLNLRRKSSSFDGSTFSDLVRIFIVGVKYEKRHDTCLIFREIRDDDVWPKWKHHKFVSSPPIDNFSSY